MTQKRAGRNRTLTLEPEEIPRLRERLLTPEKLAAGESVINRILYADLFCVLDRIPGKFADLVLADPPYNLNKNFGGERFSAMPPAAYEEWLSSWLPRVCSKLKPDGSLYLCCDWRCSAAAQRVLEKEMHILNRITWQREKGRGCKKNWKNAMEDIWFCTVSDDYVFNLSDVKMRRRVIAPYRDKGAPKDWEQTPCGNFRDTCPSNFWDDISVPYWSMAENTSHPTQKPEKLLAKLILASSDAGDLVLDPFLGSGSTSVTAKKLSRHYTGIEKSPLYCAWAEKRLEDAKRDKTIQGYNDGVFWERNTAPRANKIKKSENK